MANPAGPGHLPGDPATHPAACLPGVAQISAHHQAVGGGGAQRWDNTFFLTYSIFSAVLGMLQFGYNTGVINAPEKNIENFMKDVYKDRYGEDISEEFIQQLYSVAVSIFAIGGMLGGFSGGWMANRFGRLVEKSPQSFRTIKT